jgi:hypothetical protein
MRDRVEGGREKVSKKGCNSGSALPSADPWPSHTSTLSSDAMKARLSVRGGGAAKALIKPSKNPM